MLLSAMFFFRSISMACSTLQSSCASSGLHNPLGDGKERAGEGHNSVHDREHGSGVDAHCSRSHHCIGLDQKKLLLGHSETSPPNQAAHSTDVSKCLHASSLHGDNLAHEVTSSNVLPPA